MQNIGIQIRVSDLLFALQKRWKVIVSLSLVGLVFGLLLSAMTVIQSSYQSYTVEGSFIISTINDKDRFINGYDVMNDGDYHLAESMVDTVLYVLTSDRLMDEVINEEELLGVSPEDLQKNLRATQYLDTPVVEMQFVWNSADVGVAIWEDIITHTNAMLPQTLQLGRLFVINPPTAIDRGMSSSRNILWLVLTLLGFFAGVGFAVLELLMNPTLNNVRDVENVLGLETLGVIPMDKDFGSRKITLLADDAATSEIVQDFSAAAYILRNRLGTKEEHHCFYVTSAASREGRTTVAANLAIQLSDMEHSTLLIDFDTRNPNLGSQFLEKVDYSRSINAVYRGDTPLEEAITTLTGHLDILPMVLEHHPIPMDSTVVDMINRLKEKYEYVILDSPPVGMVSDALSLNQVANTVVYVVGYDAATLPEIQSSLEKLDKSGIRVLGCIVNGVQSSRSLLNDESTRSVRRKRKTKAGTAASTSPRPRTDEDELKPVQGKKKAKKEAPGRKNGKKSGPAKDTAAPAPAQTGTAPRDILEDTMAAPAASEGSMSNSEVLDELLKMGMDGSWENGETKDGGNGTPAGTDGGEG